MSQRGNPETNIRDGQVYRLRVPKRVYREMSAAAKAVPTTINRWAIQAIVERLLRDAAKTKGG